jgi:hypothetical protein
MYYYKNNYSTPVNQPKKILLKHVGNMGDHLFLVGPALEVLSQQYPQTEITLVTAWGYKDHKGHWGERNQDGFCISLMQENPHIDHLVHWHDKILSLEGEICHEGGKSYPTWNKKHYESVKKDYDLVAELDFGLGIFDNPVEKVFEQLGLKNIVNGNYPFYGSENDWKVGKSVAEQFPGPRIVFLESINGQTMRGWDPEKTIQLENKIKTDLGITPIWFGAKYPKTFDGRGLTLRENIAFAGSCDIGIGVMSGPLHFAAAAGLQTICLYGGQPLHRAAPSFFLNPHISDPKKYHITIDGPTCNVPCFLKREKPCKNLSPTEAKSAKFRSWQEPGRQSDKSCVATIAVDLVFAELVSALKTRGLI